MQVFWIVVSLLAAVSAFGAEEVIFAQIVHRHGARGPITPANQSIMCPPGGCGLLNDQGIDMLLQLGGLLRTRYGSAFFSTTSYNISEIYTRSTSLPRTLQSADALLRGVFTNLTAYYPVVYTVEFVRDTLLLIDAMPSYALYYNYIEADIMATLDRHVAQLFPSNATIGALVAEAHLEGYCATAYRAKCLMVVEDIATSLYAVGGMGAVPTMAAELSNLHTLLREHNKMIFAYNSSVAVDQQRGSAGQPLVSRMIANFQSFINKNITTKLLHYSAHDTTVMPFCVTVGDPEEMRPLFGQMYILELIRDAGAYYVRGTKGAPGQSPSNHTYTTGVLRLGGINANGSTYWTSAATDRVPLADFAQFVASSAPQSSLGSCYMPPAALSFIGCNALSPATSTCTYYRQLCPTVGCPGQSYLANTDTYDCVLPVFPESGCMPRRGIGALAACTSIGGILLGAGIMFALQLYAAKAAIAKDYSPIS